MFSRLKRSLVAILAAMALIVPAGPAPRTQAASPPPPAGPGSPCPDGAPLRTFKIHAVQLDLVYNKYGQHQPDGIIYVLNQNRDQLLAQVAANPGRTVSLAEPLAIRSNLGDCIEIEFKNELNEPASIHPIGIAYDVLGSDGMAVGFNPDTTAPAGGTVRYRWYPEREGTYFFADGAHQAVDSHPLGTKSLRLRGLFGALIVEPAGATWSDPKTGGPLLSGTKAIIKHPTRPDWREHVVFFHDGAPIKNPDGTPAHLYTINYRAEPMGQRLAEDCPDCNQKSLFYSSWVHGDPGGGDVVFPSYRNDPVVFHVVGAQVEELHVFHLHANRWKTTPGDPNSNTVDSLSISPGSTYQLWLDGGAGYKIGTVGDILFHCHFFPHYNEGGMWGMFRVYDKLQPDLMPLEDRPAPPAPTLEEPGFPHFIAGQNGYRPPKPPDPDLRLPTPVERTSLKTLLPGAPMVNPCPSTAPIRRYEITVIQRRVEYNEAGDHDPMGRLYVLKQDAPAVLSGAKAPEPLTIRANQGDCVEVTFGNDLPVNATPNEMSIHIHYVAFDVLGSDGTAVGYNYDQGIRPGDRIRYRWYADEKGPIYFHDHQSGSVKHGAFGSLIVEPPGSYWIDPTTGQPAQSGPNAIIIDPSGQDYRESTLYYQDWVPLFDRNGRPVDGGHEEGEDEGTMGINYTNAPFWHRSGADPAYVFSSWVHGDPKTPIIEAYPGDPVKLHLLSGSFEEPHNFLMHGVRWQREPRTSGDTAAQTITTSEYFDFSVQANPAGLLQRDYLYGSMSVDDLWNGMWGFFRVWGTEVPHVQPLPDRGAPTLGISLEDLARLTKTGTPPPTPINQGSPCPLVAPVKSFDIVAFTHDITHNRYGDHDPYGIVFALAEQEEAIRSGAMPAEPLVIRANAGDCIQVTLLNKLPSTMNAHQDHARVMVDHPWPNSNRISLHPQLLLYDVQGSDGATVGYNYDQSVPPGGVMSYTWYADRELGTVILWDMADVRSHRHHGAFGLLIVEPEGAEYRNPKTGEPLKAGPVADIIVPDGQDFREYALLVTDGMYSVNRAGACPTPPGPDDDDPHGTPCNQLGGGPEHQGAKGINYRSAPFAHRFGADFRPEMVFSSHVHGDPATPVLRAYLGDPVRIRLAQPADKSPGMAFHLAGHLWSRYGDAQAKHVTGVTEAITPGIAVDLTLIGGAGGTRQKAGDWIFQELKLVRYLEGGLWGIFRVLDQGVADLKPLPDRRPTPPTGLKVSTPATRGTLDLQWDRHQNPNVTGYHVYRSLLSGGTYERITAQPVTGTAYSDSGLLDGVTYHYVITAVDRFNNESLWSTQASGNTKSLLGL